MSISLCMIASDPPERLAAVIGPLRSRVDEIILGVDSRVPEAISHRYAAIGSQVFRVEFRLYERHLAWLYDQCSCDWILRLDGDEVPSQAFIERLPELVASQDVRQYFISRAWLYPDPTHVLDEAPWSADFLNRLVKNDGTLRFRGEEHHDVGRVSPCAYVQEPIYHLDLLMNNEESRRNKAIAYEVALPGAVAPGGGRMNEAFYLPELRASSAWRPTPPEDLPAIRRSVELDFGVELPPSAAAGGCMPFVSLQQMDAYWEGRRVPDSAYRAVVEPYERELRMIPSEWRAVYYWVTNTGTERWPWSLGQKPEIRIGSHWLNADGTAHTWEGGRAVFPKKVEPGEKLLMPLQVIAPNKAGEYILEVDVLHEGVRWFDSGIRQDVTVAASTLPPLGVRLVERLEPPDPIGTIQIPNLIHRIWLGNSEMPGDQIEFGQGFQKHHPGWSMKLWTDDDLEALGIGREERRRSRSASELSNLARFEILDRFGGIYVDTDVECLQAFGPLLGGIRGFAALELPGRVGTAVLGSVPGLPAFHRAAVQARRTVGLGAHSADSTGPYFLSLILETEPEVAIFGAHLFYPFRWDQPPLEAAHLPGAYAIHHWCGSWNEHRT